MQKPRLFFVALAGLAGPVAAGVLAALAACSPLPTEARPHEARAVADLGPVPAGAAQICVLRPAPIAAHVSMAVRDNGRLVGATRGATFFCYLAGAGAHQITSVDDDTGPTFLRAHAGARYWLHQDVTELAGEMHAHLDWVDEATGLEMVDACDARVRVAVPGHDDEPAAQPIAPATKL